MIILNFISWAQDFGKVESIRSGIKDPVCVCKDSNDQVNQQKVESEDTNEHQDLTQRIDLRITDLVINSKIVVSHRRIENGEERSKEAFEFV